MSHCRTDINKVLLRVRKLQSSGHLTNKLQRATMNERFQKCTNQLKMVLKINLTQSSFLYHQTIIKDQFQYTAQNLSPANSEKLIHNYKNWQQYSKYLDLYFICHFSVLHADRWNILLLIKKREGSILDYCALKYCKITFWAP